MTQPTLNQEQFFFQHYGVTQGDLQRYLAAALSAGGDYADLYFEYLSSTSLMVDESMVKSASQGISAGCGVRVVSGERTGYAYTDDLSADRILHAARTAALIASAPEGSESGRLAAIPGMVPLPSALPPGCAFAPRCPRSSAQCSAAAPRLAQIDPARASRCIKWRELA